MFKLWLKDTLTRHLKVIDIHQRKDGCASHKLTFSGVTAHNANDNAPHLKLGAVFKCDWLVRRILVAPFNTAQVFE